MSHSPNISSDVASNDFDSVAINPPKVEKKWNRMICIILGFPIYTLWNIIVLITVLVNFFFVSTCLCFKPHALMDVHSIPLYVICDTIYFFNFILLLLHRFWGQLNRYLKATVNTPSFLLLLDLITFLSQASFIIHYFKPEYDTIILYCRLVSFLRLHNLLFFRRIQNNILENRWIWFMIHNIIVFLIVLHSTNILWYIVACKSSYYTQQLNLEHAERNKTCDLNKFDRWYFFTTYLNVQLIFNVGFGDFYPITELEVIWFIIVIITGKFLCMVFVSRLCWLMINSKFHKAMYAQKVTYVNKYVEDVSHPTKSYVKYYYENIWKKQNGIHNVSIFTSLPSSLQMDITYDLNCGLLHRSILLKELPIYIKRRLSLAMKNVFLLPGESIYYKYVVKKYMVCIEDGVLEVLYDDDDHSPVILFKDGTILGETSLFWNIPAKATVQAAKYTQLKILEKVDFISIMIDYPDDLLKLRQSIEKRLNVTLRDNTLKCIESQNLKRIKANLYKNRLKTDVNAVRDCKKEYLTLYKVSSETTITPKSFICVKNNFPWILQENSSLLKIWKFLISITQVVLCLLYPYYAIFERQILHSLYIFGIFADVSCFIDILIQCTTALHFRDRVVVKVLEIIDHRLDNWAFYCDVFSLFPVEVWALLVENQVKRDRYYNLLKLNRMLRIWRINYFFQLCNHGIVQTSTVVWIIKTISYMFIFTYYTSCIFYINACLYEVCEERSWFHEINQVYSRNSTNVAENNSPLQKSIYFTIMSIFHVGLNGILPKSESDIALVIFSICLAALLKSIGIAQLLSSTFLKEFCKRTQNILFSLNTLLKYFNVSKINSLRIRRFLLVGSYFDDKYGKQVIQKTASSVLEAELHATKIRNILSEIPLLKMVDTYFLAIIEKDAKIFKLPANEVLYYYGDPTRLMFVIQKGFCGLYNAENILVQTLGPKAQFGMIEMILGLSRKHTVVAITDCIVVSIEYSSFLKTIKTFPREQETINRVIKSPNFIHFVKDIECNLDNIPIDYVKVQQNSFICACSNWIEYWHTYGQKLGFFWFFGLLFIPATINPDGYFLIIWNTLRCIMITILGLVSPLLIMSPPLFDYLYWVFFICHASLYVDMYILLHVAYYNKRGLFKTHPIYTAWYYITHSFLLDLIAALPMTEIYLYFKPLHSGGHDIITHILAPHQRHCEWRLISLIQFHRVFKWFDYFESTTCKLNKLVNILKWTIIIVLFSNLLVALKLRFTCNYEFKEEFRENLEGDVFYDPVNDTTYYGKLVCQEGYSNSSVFRGTTNAANKYLIGIYSITNILTHTGLEDTTLTWFTGTVLLVFIGFVLFTLLTSVIVNFFSQQETITIDYRKNVAYLKTFLKKNKVPKELKKKVLNHFIFEWEYTKGLNYISMLHSLDLNRALTEDVLMNRYENFLKYSALCNDLDITTIRLIIGYMKLQSFRKGEIIIRHKDIISNMYVIVSGQVDILNEEKMYVITIGIGDEHNFLKEMESDEETSRNVSRSPSTSRLTCLQLWAPCRWFNFSIRPDHCIVKVIDFLTFLGSFINMISIPYVLLMQVDSYFSYIDLCLEPIFYLRILINLHKGYFNYYGNLITSNKKIILKYFNSPIQVLWDIVPNLPICLACFIFPRDKWLLLYSCLRLLHLLRIYYILKYFKKLERKLELHSWLLVLKLTTLYFILIHMLSCCWYIMVCTFGTCKQRIFILQQSEKIAANTEISKIILSYYYTVSTITNTGLGDILPEELSEIIFTIIVMVVGKIATAIFIGGILRSIYLSNIDISRFEDRAKLLKKYLINQHLSGYQMRRVWQYLRNLWNYETECQLPRLVDYMPYALLCDVMTSIYDHHLQDSFLFRNLDESLIRQICSKLTPMVFFRDDYIVKYGDTNSCMYFIHEGDVCVLTKHSDLTETQHVLLHPNDMFGVSQGVKQEIVHHFTYRAASNVVKVLVLCFDSWSHLLQFFPSDERLIFTRVQKSYTKM